MTMAHIRSILAASLLAASYGAFADAMVKVSPLDGVPRGSASSAPHPRGAMPARTQAIDAGATPAPTAESGGVAAFSDVGFNARPKTIANGLFMAGAWAASWLGSTVSVSLGEINNESYTRSSGTLRLELWAVASPPARAAGFSGYKLATFATLSPLPTRMFYSDIVRTATMSYPPDGTYWLVLALTEYDPANCNQSDGYCLQDSLNSQGTSTFGNAAPPPPPPPTSNTSGVEATSLGARATVSSSATAFGGFSVAGSARAHILVRGNSLGTLGVTQAFMDAPRVRLYNAAGADLVSQAGLQGFNFCLASNSTDLPVVQLYQGRGQPVHSRDSCYSTVLPAGTYTFSVTPSNGSTSNSATSATFSGEVLFEVTLRRP